MLPDTEPMAVTETAAAKVILVVEDDSANAELLMHVLLLETPYQVYLAPDGIAALQLMSHVKPDLFILDYRLPGMSGIELYESLHAHPRFNQTPALILSACLEGYQEEIERHKLVALAKPFDVDELLALIAKMFDQSLASQQSLLSALS
jgi:CheY-like chemotaxis protein